MAMAIMKLIKRKFSWNFMRLVNGLSNVLTLFIGDFHEVLLDDEHVSLRRPRPRWQIEDFRQVIHDCGMFDIGYTGFKYTWCNNFVSPNSTRARLDRALASQDWKDSFLEAKLFHLSTNTSDHLPLLLELGDRMVSRKQLKNRFRFEEGWCLYEESRGVVHQAWDKVQILDPGERLLECIRNGRLGLLQWKRESIDSNGEGFTIEEIKHCLFSMNGAKAPGPDGMPAKFFQHYWTTVGGAICDMFRLIALCNTAAKVIAKALAIRLKKYLPSVISDIQRAFVPHRLIIDNILLAYEAHHVIKQRKSGTRGYMSIKICLRRMTGLNGPS
ncbi:hypothetical protein LIER_28708 [Lithospermum erythrorhizon]|uniref:Reverse transcriptase n=1 Tax=Lithospermum erythrorhizon TaxID=34254 RepID=A0AAV3RIA9_LITER